MNYLVRLRRGSSLEDLQHEIEAVVEGGIVNLIEV